MAVTLDTQSSVKKAVAIANSEVWWESVAGTFIQLPASDDDINTADNLNMASAFQKAFIVNGSNLKIADFVNVRLTHAALTTPHAKGDVLTQATSNAKMIVDYTNAAKTYTYGYVTSGTWNCTNSVTGSGSGTGFTPTGIFGMLTHTALATAHTAEDVLTQAVTGATMTVKYTDTTKTHTWGEITSGTFNTTNQVTGSGSGTAFTPTATDTSPPLWYSWTVYQGDTATYGTMPNKAYLICIYRGRVVTSGNPEYPEQWYMSKTADPFNFLYGADDAMSAVAGNNADAGQCSDIVRALIPFHDDYLIFGCASTMWVLRGDPVAGGSLDNLSDTTGVFGARSWCFDGDGNLYIFGTGGVYKIDRDFTRMENLSGKVLPELVKDEAADPTTHRITMGFDRKRNGLVIAITTIATGANSNYFFSLHTNGFYPEIYPNECGAYSLFYYDANDPAYSDLLIGCKDGYIRKFLDTAKDDDIGGTDQDISSYVTLPILPLAEFGNEGKLSEMAFHSAGGASSGAFSDSDGFSWSLFSADDAETCLEDIVDGATAFTTGTVTGTGRTGRVRPKMRGAYAGLKLANSTASQTFAINSIGYETQPAGSI
uniref:Uncharacterized protein n=1 Tax=viral metagenome TaxID=1070528 RepID=A0A6M3J0N9_9ZZZZ